VSRLRAAIQEIQLTLTLLESLTQRLDGAHGRIGAVVEAVGRAQKLAAAVLQGGQPGPMLARLEAIRTALLAAADRRR
jgi:hypothetical protein